MRSKTNCFLHGCANLGSIKCPGGHPLDDEPIHSPLYFHTGDRERNRLASMFSNRPYRLLLDVSITSGSPMVFLDFTPIYLPLQFLTKGDRQGERTRWHLSRLPESFFMWHHDGSTQARLMAVPLMSTAIRRGAGVVRIKVQRVCSVCGPHLRVYMHYIYISNEFERKM